MNETAIQNLLKILPDQQKEAVSACIAASKVSNAKGIRYTLPWIYECLLLRIKSKKAYDHIRQNNILCLPTSQTLNRYIKSIKGTYGFQESVFNCLSKKASAMEPSVRRGKKDLIFE